MKIILLFFTLLPIILFGQDRSPELYGFRHLQMNYKGDKVDILVKSQKGEENISKPIFLFLQGSTAKPLIITENGESYRVFPFYTDSIVSKYHLVIIGRPNIPVIYDREKLDGFEYVDPITKKYDKRYVERNYLDYYVQRNKKVLDYLLKQKWVDNNRLVVSSHSEGSTIGSKLCSLYPKITHFIYSGGNPFGRFSNIIQQIREKEISDTTSNIEGTFNYWSKIVKEPNRMDNSEGDTYKCSFDYSIPPINYLRKVRIPVLVSYGTMDYCSPFNDYMRLEFIKDGKTNFTFKSYVGLEHNFFPKDKTGKVNNDEYNWDKVSDDWLKWLDEH